MSGISPDAGRQMGAKLAVKRAARELVEFPADFEVRPPWPGAEDPWTPHGEPLALPAVTAAWRVRVAAVDIEREAIAHARGQGKTWEEIGEALGPPFARLAQRAGVPLGEAAWQYAAYSVLPGEEVPHTPFGSRREGAEWQCWACTGRVVESHPDSGADAEQGHRPGCARLAARRERDKHSWQEDET